MNFVTCTKLDTGHCVKALCTDGGGEYTRKVAQRYLASKGIKHEMTTAHTPQHNSVTEHMNWTLLDKVCSMLSDTNLPQSYWFDALKYAVAIHNMTLMRTLDNMTPDEAWSGNKPDDEAVKDEDETPGASDEDNTSQSKFEAESKFESEIEDLLEAEPTPESEPEPEQELIAKSRPR
jgi:hypothetical protein